MQRIIPIVLAVFAVLTGCAQPYKSQEVPFRPPSAYTSMEVVAGAQIAAEAYPDPGQAAQVFGFDIRKAGLLPVQVVIDNAGEDALQINPKQTFLIDGGGNYWNLLDNRTAYRRVSESTEYANVVNESGKSAFWGALGGAVVGAAIAVVSGENVGEVMGKGAVVGGATGAVLGGAEALQSPEKDYQISRDLGSKSIENRPIRPGELGRGFLFFPGEAPSGAKLRLQIEAVRTGKLYTLIIDL